MALFGKLFEKKTCDLCGGEIGLLGNRKLEDGNMCKECGKKLSPWFSDRKNSTVEEIRAQLSYREDNKEEVAKFRITRSFGENMKLLLDEDAGKFMVTDRSDIKSANPDVLSFSDVTGCTFEIDEDESEIMREDKDGNEISYVPPRYCYQYDFYINVQVRNPYFNEIRFQLNDSTVELQHIASPSRMAVGFDPERSVEYRRFKEMGEEIREILLGLREQVRAEATAAAKPKLPQHCPNCGSTTVTDAYGCCEYCGSYLGE